MTIPGIFFFLQRNAVLSLGMLEKGGGGGGSLFFGGLDPSFLSETLFLVLVLLYLYVVIQYPWQHYLHYQTQWRRRRMHLEEMRHFTPSSSQSYQENESIDHNHPNQEEEEEDLRHPTLLRPRKKRKKVKETTNTTSSSNWKFTTTWSFPWVPSLLKASITLHASSPLSILSLRGWTSWYWGWSWLTPMLATVGVLYLQRDGVLRTSTWQSFIHVWNPWYVLFLLLLRPCFHLMQRTSMSEESPSKVRKEPRSSTWVAFHTNPTTTTTTKKKKKTMKKKNPLPISFRKGRKNGADGYPAKMTSLLSSVNPSRNTGSQPGALRRPPQHPSTSFFTRPIPSSNEPSPVHASLSNNSPPSSPTPVDSTPETPLPFSSSHEDPPRNDLGTFHLILFSRLCSRSI
ncbi:hypothetical protein HMI55_001844 [Coelomomyces lativittatus]|nr:hypothetical protein HMI55_001844 [Coelomomyces lativittatus]